MKPDRVLAGVRKKFVRKGKVNTDDGVKIDFADSWVHLRKSNTEPIVRIIAEARSIEEANKLVERFTEEIRKAK
jgi:phosphomannomutase